MRWGPWRGVQPRNLKGSAIELAFVAGDNQRPIPNVEVSCWTDWGNESKFRNLRATRDGTLRITLPKNLVELKLSHKERWLRRYRIELARRSR
jgi:hypothetical protein